MIQQPLTSTLFPYTTLFRSPANTPLSRSNIESRDLPMKNKSPLPLRASTLPAHSASESRNHRLGSAVDRKSTRLNSSHEWISYAVFCLKKKKKHVTQ